MRRTLQLNVLLTLLLLAWPSAAQDQRERASEYFRQGASLFKEGKPREAAEAFEHAHELVPHGATLYNAGLAWEASKSYDRAAQSFHDALALGGLSAVQTSDAHVRLEALADKVGQLRITAPRNAKISIQHIRDAAPPVVVFLQPGDYEVAVVFDDGQQTSRAVSIATEERELDIRPPKLETNVDDDAKTSSVGEGMSRRTWGWVAVGGAGALSGAAIYLGLEALEARDTFNDSGHTDGEAHDRAASMRTWTNVAWVAAGASAATGVVLLLGADDEPSQAEGARLQVNAGSVSISGRF